MADKKLSELTAADALTGTEAFAAVQGGVTKKATAQQIADFAGGGAETFLELTDTPAGYGSSANFSVRVNGAETALEFVDLNTLYAQLGSANVFTDVQTIESAAPEIVFSETDTTDQNWRLAAGGGVYSIQDINDSFVFIRNNIRLTHGGGMQVGAPTGGDQGAGTVNATGLYKDGVGVPTLDGGADANFTAMPQIGGDSFVWATKAIGEPFGIRDDWSGSPVPPTDNPNFRFIKLTAGEDGVGEFNEGLLISESVSGSAPLVVATAVIDHAASPIDGETVNLWNTEGRYPKAGTSPGTVANDQMQQITGAVATGARVAATVNPSGAFTAGSGNTDFASISGATSNQWDFDSANSPGARTGDSTDVKHQQVTYYMRIA